MSDIGKTALKTKIDNKVYENSSQAITGTIMNEVLQDVVDTLADGGNLDAGSVDTANIKDGAVTDGKLDTGVLNKVDWATASQSYYRNSQAGNVAAKTLTTYTDGYVMRGGGSLKVTFENANTADNATLNIDNKGAKPLYYNGARVSSTNSWAAGETVEIYYNSYNSGIFYAKKWQTDVVSVSQNTNTGEYQIKTGDKVIVQGNSLDSVLLGIDRINHYNGNLSNTKIENYDSAKYFVIPINGGDSIVLSASGRVRVMVLSEFEFNPTLPYNVTYATGESQRGTDSGSYNVSFTAPNNARFLVCSYMSSTGVLTTWNGININGINVLISIYDIIRKDVRMNGNIANNSNLNTLPFSTIYAIPYGYNVTNIPTELTSGQFSGCILTFRQSINGDTGGQILITAYGMFYRYYSGTFFAWQKIPNGEQFDRLKDILGYSEPQFTYTQNSHVGISGDTIYMSTDAGWKITNAIYLKRGQKIHIKAVGYLNAVGILTQFNGETPQNVIIRSVDSTYRWYEAEIIADGTYKISGSSNANCPFIVYIADAVNAQPRHPFQAFLNVGVIGDSLANGATITDNTWYSNVKMSWPQVMKRMTGNNVINFTRGGLTAYDWMLDDVNGYAKAILPENICETYLIGLGVNDGSRISKYESGTPSTDHLFPMGTMSDINDSDYTQNGDSFYGHYAKIIQAMKASYPKDKFFCIKLPTKLSDDSSTSAEMSQRLNYAIQEICDHFSNCVTIQLANYTVFSERHSEIYDNERGGHYNAITYQYFAELIYQALNDKMMSEEWKYRYIELINTEYENLIPSSTE